MIDAYPLCWPSGYKRALRPVSSRFGRHTLYVARYQLKEEVRRLGGRKLIISTNMKTRNDGDVYSNAKEPDDSGVAVYFDYQDRNVCLACDAYRTVWENTYAKALNISMIHAKNEMCIHYGPCRIYGENFDPPKWGGHFVEYHGEIYFRKTTKEYTIAEMGGLIEGILTACQDNGIDVEDLIIENKDWYGRKTA